MNIERVLTIREPWIAKILNGEKTWEMRPGPTARRGWIGLAAKGANAVSGVARLVESRFPLHEGNYRDHENEHAIPPDQVDDAIANNWVFPWVLADVIKFDQPIPFSSRPGAVTFVGLDASVAEAIAEAASRHTAAPKAAARPPAPVPAPFPAVVERTAGRSSVPIFTFSPQRAKARGTPVVAGEFLVMKGSTAMQSGSPLKKRDQTLRDRLVREGILIPVPGDADLFEFAQDYVFKNSSNAAGVVKDGNASGPSLWRRPDNGQTLKDYLTGRVAS